MNTNRSDNEKNTSKLLEACFFSTTPCLTCHVEALLTDKRAYRQFVLRQCDQGIFKNLSQAVKSRTIAALHTTQCHKILNRVLDASDVVDISKACALLDRPRQMRQLERKIQSIEEAHPHLQQHEDDEPIKKRHKRGIDHRRRELKQLQSQVDSNDNSKCGKDHQGSGAYELITSCSVSGALARKVRAWAKRNLTKDFLEFVILTMPLNNWRALADIVHFRPDDFSVPYFLSAVHGEELPADSFVKAMQELLKAPSNQLQRRFLAMVEMHPQVFLSYAFLRMHSQIIANSSIATLLAQNIPLGQAVWYLEELAQASKTVPAIVSQRLQNEGWEGASSKALTSFGKLLERILTFRSRKWNNLANELLPVAKDRLSALKESWASQNQKRTVVFGDASSSMQAAIQAATILATMCSVCWGGELCFFHSTYQASPYPRPSTVEETLEVCRIIRAQGCTSLAAALWPYFEKKIVIDRIVLVTDEGENTSCHGYRFAPLLKAYRDQVNRDVQLIVISVGSGYRPFQQSLEAQDIDYKRVEIDAVVPDLTKFDSLLGQLAMEASPSEEEETTETTTVAEDPEFVLV